jgi:hypothetical protein
MKSKMILLLMLPAVFMALAVNAQAKSHKIRVKMTGCLQNGAEPNTFVLNNKNKGYTRHNTTGQTPLALARADNTVVLLPQENVDLQKHVGQRVTVSGWVRSESDRNTGTYYSSTYPESGSVAVAPQSSYGAVGIAPGQGSVIITPQPGGGVTITPQSGAVAAAPQSGYASGAYATATPQTAWSNSQFRVTKISKSSGSCP